MNIRGIDGKFLNGHCITDTMRKNMVIAQRKRFLNESIWNKGKGLVIKTCVGCGKKFQVYEKWEDKKYCNQKCYIYHMTVWNKGLTKMDDIRVARQTSHGLSKRLDIRKKISKTIKKLWQNEEYREMQLKIRRDEKYKEGIRNKNKIISSNRWKDKTFQSKIKNSLQIRPNKAEKDILNSLSTKIPLKYTGDMTFFIGTKNPDFVIEGTNKCIDLFGEYWHRNESPVERIKIFEENGYKLLIVWYKKWIKDRNEVIKEIINFSGGVNV